MEKLHVVRYSTFDIRFSNGEVSSIFDIRYSDGEVSSIFDIRTAAVDHLIRVKTFFGNWKVHDFEYQITNSIFVIRYSIFELSLFFVFLGSITFFSIRKVTEYQLFNIKTNFKCTILNFTLSIRYS